MELLLSYFVVDFDPFALRFPEAFFLEGIRWYGLSYLAGFVIAVLLFNAYSRAGKSPLSKDDNLNFITYILFGVILGGRIGYMLFYDFHNFASNPLSVFQIWKGGMSSHGGFIGTMLAMIAYSAARKVSFWKLADIACASCPPGLFLGRLANFINGELWGKISAVPWAMIFPNSAPANTPISEIAPRHPSQLYEAGLEGLFLFAYIQFRFWRAKKLPSGQLAGEFLTVYSLLRIFCEIFREPDFGVSLIAGLSRGTFYSLLSMALGIAIIVFARLKEAKGKC